MRANSIPDILHAIAHSRLTGESFLSPFLRKERKDLRAGTASSDTQDLNPGLCASKVLLPCWIVHVNKLYVFIKLKWGLPEKLLFTGGSFSLHWAFKIGCTKGERGKKIDIYQSCPFYIASLQRPRDPGPQRGESLHHPRQGLLQSSSAHAGTMVIGTDEDKSQRWTHGPQGEW